MAVCVLGAPGSGKSLIRPALTDVLRDWVVLDWDDFMHAAGELSSCDIRGTVGPNEMQRAVTDSTPGFTARWEPHRTRVPMSRPPDRSR